MVSVMGSMDKMLRMVERLIEAGLTEEQAIEAVARLLVLTGEVDSDADPEAEAA